MSKGVLNMKDFRKPNMCPECSGVDIRFIVRGVPSEEAMKMVENSKAVLGGCFVNENMPMWRCMSCENEFTDDTDPKVTEFRELEKRILEKHRKKT